MWRGVAGIIRSALSRMRPARRAIHREGRLMAEVYDGDDPTWPMVVVQWRDTHSAPGTWLEPSTYEPSPVLALSVG